MFFEKKKSIITENFQILIEIFKKKSAEQISQLNEGQK